jgi:hypothetical protein
VSAALELAAISLLATVASLLVFKATTHQARLSSLRRAMLACLFEIRLQPDDPRAILRALWEMLRLQAAALRGSLAPLAILLLPMLLVAVGLDARYSHRALRPGEAVLVRVRLAQRTARPLAHLEASGLTVETPALWLPALNELDWRLRALKSGRFDLQITVGGEGIRQEVRVSDAIASLPGQPSLPRGVASVAVGYPAARVPVLGWELHWWVVFLGWSALFALLLQRPLRVSL